mgnify:CR=1 FL=1
MNLNFDDVGDTKRAQDFLKEKLQKRMAKGMDTGYTSDRPMPGQGESKKTYSAVSSEDFGRNFTNKMTNKGYLSPSQDKARDGANFNASQVADDAFTAANKHTKSMDMFKGLRQGVNDMSAYYRNSSRKRTLGLFGDVWNVKGSPEWVSPDAPEKIEANIPDFDDIKSDIGIKD